MDKKNLIDGIVRIKKEKIDTEERSVLLWPDLFGQTERIGQNIMVFIWNVIIWSRKYFLVVMRQLFVWVKWFFYKISDAKFSYANSGVSLRNDGWVQNRVIKDIYSFFQKTIDYLSVSFFSIGKIVGVWGKNSFYTKKVKIMSAFVLVVFCSSVMSVGIWLAVSNVLDIGENIVLAAESGTDSMKKGVEELKSERFEMAAQNFHQANIDFEEIKRSIQRLGNGEKFLDNSISSNEYDSIGNLIEGLICMSRGAKLMSLGLDEIAKNADGNFSNMFFAMVVGDDERELFPMIDKASEYMLESSEQTIRAIELLSNIDRNMVPENYRDIYDIALSDAPRYLNMLNGMSRLLRETDSLLGKNVPANYLLLFQNNNEMRPTGGFIGSYGVATFSNGKLEELEFDDVYNPDGQIIEEIPPPYPIWLMTKEWGMRDSNWDPDFRVSAPLAESMFEKGGGYSMDGVVAFTPVIVERFLEITGPVEMPDYGVVLDSENFKEVIQRKVEIENDKIKNKPKEILSDLLPILMQRLGSLGKEDKTLLWQTVLDLLNEKHILIYIHDEEIENLIEQLGWAGDMKEVEKGTDYLSMIHANIGGRKSDAYIKESVNHKLKLEDDGSLVVDLEIVRKNIEDWTWPNYSNYDYLRVYVPEGSELLRVKGFANTDAMVFGEDGYLTYDKSKGEAGLANTRVYTESGKTVFANWIVTQPWEESKVSYSYKLPFNLKDWLGDMSNYRLYIQKQSGREGVDYRFEFDPGLYDPVIFPGYMQSEGEMLVFKDALIHDLALEITMDNI